MLANVDSLLGDGALDALGNGATSMMDLTSHGMHDDPYGMLGDYDLYAALSGNADATMSIAMHQQQPTSTVAPARPPNSSATTATTYADLISTVRPTSISPPLLHGSDGASPLNVPSPSFGLASSSTGAGGDSYFPAQPLSNSPPPLVQATPTTNNGTPTAGSGAAAFIGPRVPPATAAQQLALIGGNPQPAPKSYSTVTLPYKPVIRPPLSDPARSLSGSKETLVYAYFNKGVRRMQYLLADDSTTGVTDVMYDLVIKDPTGPVTNAICSLASLHDTRLRIAHGLVHPEDPHAHEQAQKLYMDTVYQLAQKSGSFSAVEAIASLHLLSFWLFCGGGGEWHSALGMASDWLYNSEVMNKRLDPVEVLERWSPTHRFAAQATLWFDIIGSCSLKKTPRFMKLYRRMIDRNRRIAENGGTPQQQTSIFGSRTPKVSELMNQVMGCDDEVMFALAQISELAAWKDEQERAGTLSFRELVKRADAIENRLNGTKVVMSPTMSTTSRSSSGMGSPPNSSNPNPMARPAPPVWDPYNLNAATISPTADARQQRAPAFNGPGTTVPSLITPINNAGGSPPQLGGGGGGGSSSSSSATGAPGPLSIITTTEPVTLRQLSSNVFRDAAFLFLRSIVSGCNPAVPEIQESVNSLITSIQAIPSNDLDRSLAFPITLGGCLSGNAEQVQFFSERLAAQGSAVGNGSQARLLVDTVWERRKKGERGVCWRDAMVRNLKFNLLLV